ncbi:unnamed protein product, partial [marine sediment metagenome]
MEILLQTRAVSGIAALVTTPLRLVVTSAAFGSGKSSARLSPATTLALYWLMQSFGTVEPAHWGPQAPLNAAPPLAREFEARVTVAGKTWGLSGQTQCMRNRYEVCRIGAKR